MLMENVIQPNNTRKQDTQIDVNVNFEGVGDGFHLLNSLSLLNYTSQI